MLAEKLRLCAEATSIVAEQSANLVLIERARRMLQFKFSTRPCALVSVPQIRIKRRAIARRRAAYKTATRRNRRFRKGGVGVIG
jgi:hypothetical protein